MRNFKIVCVALIAGALCFGANAQKKSFKERMKEKLNAAMNKMENRSNENSKKLKYRTYNFKDDTGISGTYFLNKAIVDREGSCGIEFTKEKDGEIINKLNLVLGGKGYGNSPNSIQYRLSEKIKSKFGFSFYDKTGHDAIFMANNHNPFFLMEVSEGVYAFAEESTVHAVIARDSASFNDYDLETVQVLFEQNMSKVTRAKEEKETAKWMKNEVYKKNVNKIVFATESHHLMVRGYGNKPPKVNGKDFKTVLDMAYNMQYLAFFEIPPSKLYPGADVNIEYEMNGKKTSRTEYRVKSSGWSKQIPKLSTSDFAYRQSDVRPLRSYYSTYSRWAQDYAFVQLLYMNKDKFLVGEKYDLTVKIYTSRDGENGELLAEGTVSLLYSMDAHKAFKGDSSNPQKTPLWDEFEEFLDEQ